MSALPTGGLAASPVVGLAVAFTLSLLLTPLVRAVARRSAPHAGASTDDAVPALGGLAFVPATLVAFAVYPPSAPLGFTVVIIEAALIGCVDDLRPLSPSLKTLLLVAAAATGWMLGLRIGLTPAWLDALVTVTWLTWLANAVNVTDMEDGLAAGLTVIGCVGFLALGWAGGVPSLRAPAAALSGGLLGFLYFNVHPARIYMGDTGSLFIGFLLGGMSIVWANAAPAPASWAAPLLVLGFTNFEAVFLIVVRTLKCRLPWRASRDHSTQRLRACGMSARGAVFSAYGIATLCATAGVLFAASSGAAAWGAFGVGAAGLALLGAALSRVDMEGDGLDGRPQSAFTQNWLVHGLMQGAMLSVRGAVRGRLLDIGCGRRPYAGAFGTDVTDYVGLELDRARYPETPPDLSGDATALPFAEDTFDTVVSNQVLEHVPEPAYVVVEMARVIRPGGCLVLTAPHIWGVHEAPHDYFRFTPYGLAYMAERAGLTVERVEALAGYWVTAGARFCYYVSRFARGPLKPVVACVWCVVQALALWLDGLHRDEQDAWNHLLVARKRRHAGNPGA